MRSCSKAVRLMDLGFMLILILTASLSVVMYISPLFILSNYYQSYLRNSNLRYSKLWFKLTLITSFLLLIVTIYIVINVIRVLVWYGLILWILAMLYLVLNQYSRLRCLDTKEYEINGIKYVVCYNNLVNAWFDGKTIKVSSILKNVLSDEELLAVIYHELGHVYNPAMLRILSSLSISYWLFSIVNILLCIRIVLTQVSLLDSILIITILMLCGANATLTAMMVSWINEHEADRYMFSKAGLRPSVGALIKVYTYGSLERYLHLIEQAVITPKELYELRNSFRQFIKLKYIFSILMKNSFNFPKNFMELVTRPIYATHPPLELRLALLFYSYQG